MPRRAKAVEANGKELADLSRPNSNGAKLRSYLDRLHECQSEVDKIMQAARLKCEPHREDMKEIRKESSEAGFAAKEFNTLFRKERLEKKIENIAENLDDEQKERFEDMLAALEVVAETMGPLGQAALDAAQAGAAA